EFPLPAARSDPGPLTVGPDGNLWFGESSGDSERGAIGRVTPSGIITEFAIPTSRPYRDTAITVGPDGKLWFPENIPGAIGRIDPSAIRGTGVAAVKRSGARITAIVLSFDEALDPRTAGKRRSYSLAVGTLKRHSGFSWSRAKIAGVTYHSRTNTVR